MFGHFSISNDTENVHSAESNVEYKACAVLTDLATGDKMNYDKRIHDTLIHNMQ